jgi:hypothetical protein
MRFAVLLLAVALAGCSLPKNANDTVKPSGSTGSTPVATTPAEATPGPSSTPSTTPPTPSSPTPSPPTPEPNATEQPQEATRKVEKQFDLDFAMIAGSLVPPQNCVMIESGNMRIYNGTAIATSRGGSTSTGPLELRFHVKGANASMEGELPLSLEIPSATVADDAEALVVLQAASTGVMETRAQLALSLVISGEEPTFSVGGCQVAG